MRPDSDDSNRPPESDVVKMLRANHEARKAVETPIDPAKPKNRKRRDYILVMVAGNAFLIGLFWFLPSNAVTAIFALSGIVLFSIGVTWAFFMVMSDY